MYFSQPLILACLLSRFYHFVPKNWDLLPRIVSLARVYNLWETDSGTSRLLVVMTIILTYLPTFRLQTSAPGTPSRSRAPSRPTSRPTSPTRAGASKRKAPGPLLLTKGSNSDPLRVFPTEVSQRIFGLLDIGDLARCSRVCKKWLKSQTLNYGESVSFFIT